MTLSRSAIAGIVPPGRQPALGGLVDRGAVIAAFVGLGVAVVVAISFLLIIPIEPIYWLLSLPAGLLIGWYAGVRSGRLRGEWLRFLGNALFAGAVTGLTLAVLLLAVKALFFYADNGYPTYNRTDSSGAVIPPTCQTGAECVYQRYLADQGPALAAAGVTDAASFQRLYWDQQLGTAASLLAFAVGAALVGGVVFGITRPASARPGEDAGERTAVAVAPDVAAAPDVVVEPEAELAEPPTEDLALGQLATMLFGDEADPTPGRELLEPAKLDFSLLSLGHVDDYLDAVRTRALSDRERQVLVLRTGAYVGEVIRRHAESRTYHWLGYEAAVRVKPSIAEMAGPSIGTTASLWGGGGRFVFPLAKVAKFLDNGREDSLQLFAAATARL